MNERAILGGLPEEFYRLVSTRERRANPQTLHPVLPSPHTRVVFGATRSGLGCVVVTLRTDVLVIPERAPFHLRCDGAFSLTEYLPPLAHELSP